MGKMTLSDLVSHQEFADYVNLSMIEQSPLVRSGVVAQDPVIAQKCANAGFEGKTIDLPFLNSLDAADDAEVPVEDTAPTGTDKVTAGQDTAVVQFRRKKFGITDVTSILGGVDPARQIADQIAPYWWKQDQKILLSVLTGIFAANARKSGTNDTENDTNGYKNGCDGDMILDLTGEDGAAANLDKDSIMLAAHTDVAPDNVDVLREKFGTRVFATPKKMGAQTSEANVNAGLAAARQIAAYFAEGCTKFQVNK